MVENRPAAIRTFRLIAGTIGWIAVVVQLGVTLTAATGPDTLTRFVNFVSYFTILSNILAAAALTAPELAPASAAGRFLDRYEVRTAILVYMVVTCGVYAIMLAPLAHLHGVELYANRTLHYIMPPLYVVDWLLIGPRQPIRWGSALRFLIFPLCYGAYTLLRGAWIHYYPYPFINVNKLGYPIVFRNILLFVLLFLGLGLITLAIARWRALPAKALGPEPGR